MFFQAQNFPTPRVIKNFLIFTAVFSLSCSVAGFFIPLFGLSLAGISNGYFWQLLTFLFIQPEVFQISFGSVVHLLIYLFAIHTAASEIIQRKKRSSFYILFFVPGIIAALYLLLGMHLFKFSFAVFGLALPAYSLLVAFLMLSKDSKIFLFHTLPVKLSTLIGSALAVHFLFTLLNGSFFTTSSYLVSALVSYLYCLKFWKVNGPYPKMHPFENMIIGKKSRAKFYNFATRSQMTDDEIIDDLLDKANKQGLSFREKRRLKKYFRRKKTN